MQLFRFKSIACFLALTLVIPMPNAIANSDTPVKVHDGIWVESPVLIDNDQGMLEAYIVINNRTDRDLVVSSISAPSLGSVQIVNPSGTVISSPLLVPHHSELYMQPGGIRIQISPNADKQASDSAVLVVGIGPFDPVAVDLKYLVSGEQLPDHHDYEHCENC